MGQPPPPDPNAPPASSTTPTTLAVQRLFLGDTDLGGNPDPNAWRKLGFNVDGLVSDKMSANHCKYQEGATKSSVQIDGENGIDNSFGSNLVKIIASLMANPSQSVTDSINGGGGTWLLHLPNLGPQPSQNGVTAAMFSGAKLGLAPAWQGGDVWPVTYESVVGGNIAQPLVTFPQSYVVNGVWVGAPAASGALDLVLDGQDFGLGFRIHHPRVTALVIGTGPNAKATYGVISGVIDTEEYVAMLKQVAGSFDQTLCEGATFESIAQQIRAASDIMNDGSNGDPSKICNGISIGLGFEAMAVKLGPVAGKAPPPVQYCK